MNNPIHINVPSMCRTHLWLLVQQCDYKKTDPRQELLIVSQTALFKAATTDPKVYAKIGGDITKIDSLGCLACLKPDAFGEIVEAGKIGPGTIKALGEKWVNDCARPEGQP